MLTWTGGFGSTLIHYGPYLDIHQPNRAPATPLPPSSSTASAMKAIYDPLRLQGLTQILTITDLKLTPTYQNKTRKTQSSPNSDLISIPTYPNLGLIESEFDNSLMTLQEVGSLALPLTDPTHIIL